MQRATLHLHALTNQTDSDFLTQRHKKLGNFTAGIINYFRLAMTSHKLISQTTMAVDPKAMNLL